MDAAMPLLEALSPSYIFPRLSLASSILAEDSFEADSAPLGSSASEDDRRLLTQLVSVARDCFSLWSESPEGGFHDALPSALVAFFLRAILTTLDSYVHALLLAPPFLSSVCVLSPDAFAASIIFEHPQHQQQELRSMIAHITQARKLLHVLLQGDSAVGSTDFSSTLDALGSPPIAAALARLLSQAPVSASDSLSSTVSQRVVAMALSFSQLELYKALWRHTAAALVSAVVSAVFESLSQRSCQQRCTSLLKLDSDEWHLDESVGLLHIRAATFFKGHRPSAGFLYSDCFSRGPGRSQSDHDGVQQKLERTKPKESLIRAAFFFK
jgi:hypothetical protein